MTLTNIVLVLGLTLVAVAVVILAALFVAARTRRGGEHHDDEDYWQQIREMPDRHEQPPHPDGGVSQ